MLPVKLLKKHILNGKTDKITRQFIKKLVTMNLETNHIKDLLHVVNMIKTHTVDFQTEFRISLTVNITNVLAKIHQLLKTFIT